MPTQHIELMPLMPQNRERFITMNQAAFRVAAQAHFGPLEQEVIAREDICRSLDAERAQAFQIMVDGEMAGGALVQIDPVTQRNALDLLFLAPACHSRGIGQTVWRMIERRFPDTRVWETHTPYFETRNIHFYVNRCGFHIVEFFNPKHPDPHEADTPGGDLFFRFEKQMQTTGEGDAACEAQ